MHRQTPWNRIVTTTPAVTEAVSLDRVKRSLGLDNVRDFDTTLQELIQSASGAVSADLGRALTETSYTLYLDRWPGRQIQLPYPPLISVHSVKAWGDASETLDTFASSKYTVSTGGDPGLIWLNEDSDWPELMDRPTPIEIHFKAGYGPDTDDVPAAIQAAVAMTAAYFYDQPLPVITGTIATELPLGVSRLIDSERFQRY
jgi:uncharacterized phiE125 gp8 family phage protein|tara:strand:- start:1213 stop:1815 length:603 start_codon:yes stop_codon:yes gene_type:complete